MQDRRRWAWTHRYAVPMFVASLVAFLLSGTGLLAVLVLDGGAEPRTEACATGSWQVTSYTEETGLGSARMVGGEPVLRFHRDGTGRADFGTGMRMRVESVLVTATGDITGEISYRYEAAEQSLKFVEQRSNATISTAEQFGSLLPPGEFSLPEGPLDYTCDGDEMTFSDGEQSFELRRTG